MADINRDEVEIEIAFSPRFTYGERVISRSVVRNDGTYRGYDVGDVLVHKGDVGYVTSIGTFLQQYYIYAVEFVDTGHRVGMRAKELCTLDNLPDDVLAQLGDKAAAVARLGSGKPEFAVQTAVTLEEQLVIAGPDPQSRVSDLSISDRVRDDRHAGQLPISR